MRRIVEETPCEHDEMHPHIPRPDIIHRQADGTWWRNTCEGGSRRTLTEGQYVLIEKTDGEWPEHEAILMFSHSCMCGTDEAHGILDALSDHTEGET